jgi:protein required for attachment to host cells
MSEQAFIPHNAVVLVGDGQRAMFLRNVGQPKRVKLEVVKLLEHPAARNQDLVSDRPGRAVAGTGPGHSAFAQTDWHHLEESRFVHSVAGAIARAAAAEPGLEVVVVMPPKALGEFRDGLDAGVRRHVIAEIHKDLAGLKVSEIERHLQG